MDPKAPKSRPERIDTERNLRAVRDADDIMELARQRADALLQAARRQADAVRGHDRHQVAAARASEDRFLSDERAAAEIKLAHERADHDRALAILRAIERVETNERLLTERARAGHAVATRGGFLTMVSHDVRGILGSMAMSADMLMTIPSEGAAEYAQREAQRIRRLTGQMNRLVSDLIDLVRMESGKLHIETARQDANQLLTEMMDDFKIAATKRNITMTSQVPEGPALASFDRGRILQVLTNLVGNALKFTNPGGSIALLLERSEDGIRFTVRDTGCGIAPSNIEAMFECFSQAARSERRGLGLGLYISRGIAQAHRGKLWAESELGVGSAFYVTLPSAPAAVVVPP